MAEEVGVRILAIQARRSRVGRSDDGAVSLMFNQRVGRRAQDGSCGMIDVSRDMVVVGGVVLVGGGERVGGGRCADVDVYEGEAD